MITFVLSILFLFCALKASSIGTENKSECIDSKLNGSLEYVSILRYRSVGTLKKSFACYLITQCSVERLYRLANQIKAWQGATSAAVYVQTSSPAQQMNDLDTIDNFMAELRQDSQHSGYLTVSVLFGHEANPELWNCTYLKSPDRPLYPINALRNLATAATGADPHQDAHHIPPYLLNLDVDFLPSFGLSEWVERHAQSSANSTFHQLTRNGDAIVVPAFESSAAAPPIPTRSLHYLLSGIKAGSVTQFHGHRYPRGHGPSDYGRYTECLRFR